MYGRWVGPYCVLWPLGDSLVVTWVRSHGIILGGGSCGGFGHFRFRSDVLCVYWSDFFLKLEGMENSGAICRTLLKMMAKYKRAR